MSKHALGFTGLVIFIIAIIVWTLESYIISVILGFIGLGFMGSYGEINKKERDEKNRKRNLNELAKLSDFKSTNKINLKLNGLIAIDDNNWQIAIKSKSHGIRKFNYNQILKCEIIEDGVTISSKSTIRTIGGGLLGGAIAGNAGAIVGGLSGNSKQNNKIKNLDLKIIVKSTENPTITVRFFDVQEVTGSAKAIDEASTFHGEILRQAKKDIENWKNIIEVIIDKVDKKENEQSIQKSSVSIADEINKLNDLKNKGLLNEEEFLKQKNKLLES